MSRLFLPLKSHLLKCNTKFVARNTRFVQTGQKVSVNGVNLYYERVGNGQNNVLLLPGAIGSTRTDFAPQLEGMNREKFTLIAWDPPGYGQSRPPTRDWTDFYRRDAAFAAQMMKYSLVGWSDGGITALIIAASNPKSVQKLVAFGSNAYITEEDRNLVTKIRDVKKWSPRARQAFVDVYGEEEFERLWTSFVDNYVKLDDLCKEDLKRITQKTLILHGDEDPMVAKEHPEYLVNNIKNARLHRFPKGKHNIHQRYAEEFNAIVEKFLLEE